MRSNLAAFRNILLSLSLVRGKLALGRDQEPLNPGGKESLNPGGQERVLSSVLDVEVVLADDGVAVFTR